MEKFILENSVSLRVPRVAAWTARGSAAWLVRSAAGAGQAAERVTAPPRGRSPDSPDRVDGSCALPGAGFAGGETPFLRLPGEHRRCPEAAALCLCRVKEMPQKTYAAPMGTLIGLWHRAADGAGEFGLRKAYRKRLISNSAGPLQAGKLPPLTPFSRLLCGRGARHSWAWTPLS